MDPQACLDAVESALTAAEQPGDNTSHIEDAEEHLANYRAWRRKGGFEPPNGDARCRTLTVRLAALPADSTDI